MNRAAHIEVVDYDPRWPHQFAQVAAALADVLQTRGVPVCGIEHVGSTSVPGLAAKPVLDIDIVVDRPHTAGAIEALETVGYRYLGTLGVVDRHALRESDPPRRNVYVVVDGSLSLRNHRVVRDVLRSDESLRSEYAEVKRSLAARFTVDEIDHYVEGKSPVLQRILAAGGVPEHERSDIEATNRVRS